MDIDGISLPDGPDQQLAFKIEVSAIIHRRDAENPEEAQRDAKSAKLCARSASSASLR